MTLPVPALLELQEFFVNKMRMIVFSTLPAIMVELVSTRLEVMNANALQALWDLSVKVMSMSVSPIRALPLAPRIVFSLSMLSAVTVRQVILVSDVKTACSVVSNHARMGVPVRTLEQVLFAPVNRDF